MRAKVWASDLCKRAECHGQRCDAEHWFHHCPDNQGGEQRLAAVQAFIDGVSRLTDCGPYRATYLRALLAKPCFRLCGICPAEPHAPLVLTTDKAERDDLLRLRQVAADPTKGIYFDTTGSSSSWRASGFWVISFPQAATYQALRRYTGLLHDWKLGVKLSR